MNVVGSQAWKTRLAIPAYRIGEAASYARISPQTVASWHKSNSGNTTGILTEREARAGLSFLQLIEMAVVADMRREGVKLNDIRQARDYLVETTGLDFPFAQVRFKTDGVDIFSEVEGSLGDILRDKILSLNHGGQYTWADLISKTFRTFNYDDSGSVVSWRVAGEDKEVEINPRFAFGAPQIAGVKTKIVKARFAAGDEIDEISEDYDLRHEQVLEALIFEGLDPSNDRISKWVH